MTPLGVGFKIENPEPNLLVSVLKFEFVSTRINMFQPGVIIEYYKDIKGKKIIYLGQDGLNDFFYLNSDSTWHMFQFSKPDPVGKKNDQNPIHSNRGGLKTHRVGVFCYPWAEFLRYMFVLSFFLFN